MDKRPRGYVGLNHQTIGSDILAVVGSLKLPELTLGAELSAKLATVKADGWYAIGLLLEAMDAIEKRLGEQGLRQMGRLLFKLSHADRVAPKSAREICFGINGMYHHANRGEAIGGWEVTRFEPGHAELEKTTPHHCVMEEGILQSALQAAGVPATVAQSRCMRRGADTCLFVITSPVIDQRWGG